MKTYESTSLDDTRDAARALVARVAERAQERSTATVVGLRGELGAGKTAFAKAVAEALGVRETVTSPTFVIEKIYKLDAAQPFGHLVHIDAYRLEGGAELTTLGWSGTVAEPGNLVLVEWPERVADVLPDDTLFIDFEALTESGAEETRRITIHDDE